MSISEAPTYRNLPLKVPFCLSASSHQVAFENLRFLSGFLTAMFQARRFFPAIETKVISGRHRLPRRATQMSHGQILGFAIVSTLDLVAAPEAFYRTCASVLLLAPCALA